MEQILLREIIAGTRSFSLSLVKEDLTELYPGFFRYTLNASSGDTPVAHFRTNSYEYAPGVPLRAEEVAFGKAGEWEREIRADPDDFLSRYAQRPPRTIKYSLSDVVIVQASPRADGNSGILALWAEEAAREFGMTCTVLYPHDMDIRECIGCYQCFNTGSCIFEDDMTVIIDLVSRSRLLVLCTPVYTNTVPANLKAIVDRFQACFAAQTLGLTESKERKGIILSVAGRSGQSNFTCIKKVLVAFMHTADIIPSGEIFIDGVDRLHDIREIAGYRERVKGLVMDCLRSKS